MNTEYTNHPDPTQAIPATPDQSLATTRGDGAATSDNGTGCVKHTVPRRSKSMELRVVQLDLFTGFSE